MPTVISVENLSKSYRLGQINTGTLTYDLHVWWAKMRGKPHPFWSLDDPSYGSRDGELIWALKDLSFTVEQGEILGIIGRNGAGKSTLLKVLSRVTAPTSGRVRLKGRIASLLEVGTGFHPDLTGRENIYLNGTIMGMSTREVRQKFEEIVSFAGVEKFIDTPVKRYSSGMYVRLAFSVAAHLDPDILVVDEVLAVGDAEFQKKCLGLMGDVAREKGRTVLFVSHNMAAISQLCPRSLLLENGGLSMQGPSSQVISTYLSHFGDSSSQGGAVVTVADDDFSLLEFSVRQDGDEQTYYHQDRPIQVVIVYEIKRPIRDLLLGMDCVNSEGLVLFRAFDLDEAGLGMRNEGIYRSLLTIPANTLRPGDYSFDFLAAIRLGRWISRDQVHVPVKTVGMEPEDVENPGVIDAPHSWQVKHYRTDRPVYVRSGLISLQQEVER